MASTSRIAEPARRRAFDRKTGLLVAGTLIAVVASGWHAFALSNRQARFALVHMVAPTEPEALARAAALEAALREKDGGRPSQVAALARASLSGMALNSRALRMLALSGGEKISEEVDETLAVLASEVSRRDIGSQALRMKLAVARGDLKTVLDAYDVILRNGDGNEEQFFAPMAQALDNPDMVPHFLPYLKEKAPWVPAFLTYAIPRSENPEQIAAALKAGGGLASYANGAAVEVMLINRLLQLAQWRAAATYYSTTSAFKSTVLTSPEISRDNLVPRENGLLWFLYNQDGPIAESVANRAIVVYADAGQSSEVGRKLLYLRPGRYRLSFTYEQLDLPAGARIEWSGRCLNGTEVRNLWTVRAGAMRDTARQSKLFTLDEGCTVFDLGLAIHAGESRRSVSATITGVSLAGGSAEGALE